MAPIQVIGSFYFFGLFHTFCRKKERNEQYIDKNNKCFIIFQMNFIILMQTPSIFVVYDIAKVLNIDIKRLIKKY